MGGEIRDCDFDQMSRFGVYLVQSSEPSIISNTFKNCAISGIMVADGAAGTIKDNTLRCNVRILHGCAPTLGINEVVEPGKLMTESGPDAQHAPPAAPPMSIVDQRKPSQSVR